jgi:hypothetical protein
MGMSLSSACIAMKLLHLHPYKMNVVRELYGTDYEARVNFVNWSFHVVHDEEIYSTVVLLAMQLCFTSMDTRTE